MNRRDFLAACTASLALRAQRPGRVTPHYRQPPRFDAYIPYIQPGHDEFPEEKAAAERTARLQEWWSRSANPGHARFYVLPGDRVRFEIKSPGAYRTGFATVAFEGDRVTGLSPLDEYTAHSPAPLFRDVTASAFHGVASFDQQLSRGIPYWVAALDPALGIGIYGNQGIAAADIDNDGVDEIYVCQPGGLPNRLYKNVGGRFVDITEPSGLGILDDSSCALFLDLRNSGQQDLVLLRGAGPVLFLNNGDGTFRLREDAFQFATPPQGTFTGMAAADYDRDGKLDLYLCTYLFFQTEAQYRYPTPYHDAQNGPPNYLFRNRLTPDGTGAFEDVTTSTGLDQNNNHFSFAPAWCDYDNDGWPDLYVANDFGRNNLYKNRAGHFEDIAGVGGVEDLGPGMSASWFDYDNDGRPDLYVSNMWTAAGQRIVHSPAFIPAKDPSLADAWRRHTKGNSLYRNRGDGKFDDVSAAQGIEAARWAWASGAHDFDCDGLPEIFVTCGMLTNGKQPDLMSFFWRQVVSKSPTVARPAAAYESGWNALNQFIREGYSWNGNEPNVFFVQREGKYRDFSGVSGLDVAEDSRAFAVTDLTGDGSTDLVLKSRLGPQVRVFANQSAGSRHRIVLRLRGSRSNHDAIGARVELAGQVKWLTAGSGYLSQHTKKLHFGLGDRHSAETGKITWPSGLEQSIGPLGSGYEYEIEEGNTTLRKTPFRPRASFPHNIPPIQADNHPALHDTWFLEPIPLPDHRPGPGLVTIMSAESEETLAVYSLFRRYLFEYRADLDLPLYLLTDSQSRARKIYSTRPTESQLRADLTTLPKPYPFPGRYLLNPQRDFFKLGAALLASGYPQAALPYLEAALARNPTNVPILVLVAQINLDQNQTAKARQLLNQALALRPESAEAWNELGGVELASGSPTRAISCYQKALHIKPDLTYALLNSAEAYAQMGNDSEAEAAYRRVLSLDPNSAEANNGLGLSLARQNHIPEAKAAFERAIEIRRNYGAAINNLGVLFATNNQPADSIRAFSYGLEVAPDEDDLYLNLARAYVQSGDRDKARAVLERWLTRKPNNPTAQRALHALDGP